ncbi:branched-chain amino acid aminotransferase [Bordetella sp. 2513F-2]
MDALYWHDGRWTTENPKLLGPADHAFWMASMVFDGARAFDGLTPDLDLHCQRVVRSAEKMLMKPAMGWEAIQALCLEAVAKFPPGSELYIKPMFFCADGFLLPDADKTQFVLHVFKVPMPGSQGFSACFSPYARAWASMAPTDAKASCLYPNGQRAIRDAAARGYDNAIMLDGDGNVAEFATSNLWIAKDGVVATPADNGTFLNGITRRRVLALLREDGVTVEERTLTRADVEGADEVFSTGNYGKVVHVNRVESRELEHGPMAQRARRLYMEYARATGRR